MPVKYYINIKFLLGPDIAYIYPDFKTVLRGEFKDEKVIKGQICSLIGSKIERGICIPTFTKAEGQVYEFEEPGRKTMAKNPLVPEPWEATLSYVKQSNLDQGGEGLFCKQKRPKGKEVHVRFLQKKLRRQLFLYS